MATMEGGNYPKNRPVNTALLKLLYKSVEKTTLPPTMVLSCRISLMVVGVD
jgi:hypothetical protein